MLSRHAEATYWLARYIERAENVARVCDVTYRTLLETSSIMGQPVLTWAAPLEMFTQLPQYLRTGRPIDDDESVLDYMCFGQDVPGSLLAAVERARQNALSIRDQISTEMMEELNKLYRWMLEARQSHLHQEEPHSFFQEVKTRCHLFEGVTANTMLRDEGWHFHQAGRWLERGLQTARVLEVMARILSAESAGRTAVDQQLWHSTLRAVAAYEAHRHRYKAQLQPRQVVELLVLDATFPRSLMTAARHLVEDTMAIAGWSGTEGRREVDRLARRLAGHLSTALVDEVLITGTEAYLGDCRSQLHKLHDAISMTYFAY